MEEDDFDALPTKLKAKKKIRNAFFFFMQDLKAQWIRNGKLSPNTTMAEMPAIASPVWQNLNAEDKEYYQECAKNYKAQRKGLPPEKYYTTVKRRDCMGVPLEHHVDTEKLVIERRKQHRTDDKLSFQSGSGVTKQKFCFISFQLMFDVFDSTQDEDNQGIIPLEVGVAIYSITKGITRTYQRFIKPQSIPTGYRYDAIRHSEQSHHIPPLDFDQACDDYDQIWEELVSIINSDRLPKPPPVYTQSNKCHIAEACLAWLAQKADVENGFEGNVHEAGGLLVDLVAHGIKSVADDESTFSYLTMAMAEDLITTTAYDYEVSKRCLFHQGHYDQKEEDGTIAEENDHSSKFCTLATVQRYCFSFSEKLCGVFDVEVTENHLPEMPDTASCVTKLFLPTSTAKPRSYASFSAREAAQRASKGTHSQRGRGRGIAASPDIHMPARKSDKPTSLNKGKDLPSPRLSAGSSNSETVGVGRGRGRGMAADLSQPRQPKTPGTPPITPTASSAPRMTPRPMAGNPTGWVPKPRTGFQLEQHNFPPLGSSVASPIHQPIGIPRFPQAPPGFSQQPSPLRQQAPLLFQQQPPGITLGRGRGLFNTFEAERQQYPGNYGLSSRMDGSQ